MCEEYWLIVGVSGISCSGKTTLANLLFEFFINMKSAGSASSSSAAVSDNVLSNTLKNNKIQLNKVQLMHQDDYFYPKFSEKSIWIEEIQYTNREVMESMDMEKMCDDLSDLLGSDYQSILTIGDDETSGEATINKEILLNVLIIEGYLILNHPILWRMCDVKISLRISFDELIERRKSRVYNPKTPPKYLTDYVWPYYQKHLAKLDIDKVLVIDGTNDRDKIFTDTIITINDLLINCNKSV